MPVVLKIDGIRIDPAEDGILRLSTMIRKNDPDVTAGDSAFIWSHYSNPTQKDGSLVAVGVIVQAARSPDKKLVDLSIAISNCPPNRRWQTQDLDQFKNRADDLPETEIANEVRGFTHDHVGHVSASAAALMATYFS